MNVGRVKKLLALITALVVLSGCVGQQPTTDSDGDGVPDVEDMWPGRDDVAFGKTLTSMTIGEPETMDPALAYDSASWNILWQVTETLVTYEKGDASKVVPGLAESWDISSNGLTYTFKLRENVTFSNGAVFNADDVVWSLQRVITMGLDPSWMLADFVDSIEKIDDYNVKITLKFPYGGMIFVLACPVATILDKETYEAAGVTVEEGTECEWCTENLIGTGPYVLKEWTHKERIVLEKNPTYWKGWEGKHVETIIIKEVSEVSTRMLALKAGDTDFAYIPTTHLTEALSGAGGDLYFERGQHSFVIIFVAMNNDLPPFDDKNFRVALSYAFDYDGIIDFVVKGYGIQARGPIPLGMNGNDPDYESYMYHRDLDKAKSFYEKSKYYNNVPDITLYYNQGNDVRKQIMLTVKENLSELGITNVTIQELDWPTFIQKIRGGEVAILNIGWAPDYNDPDDYVFPFLHSEGWNPAHYNNPVMDDLIMKARKLPSGPERWQIYYEIQRIDHEDAPYLWVYQSEHYTIRRAWVQGYYYNPIAGLKYYDIWKEVIPGIF
ncbi:MAG: ABC transporter substrate-binding protein [Candidatus Methanofastidiosia archaeon]